MQTVNDHTTGYVISKDGTEIGYRHFGAGPGLILVHGGMMSSQNFINLALHLSADFTVYVPDRRGRGLSQPPGTAYGLEREAEDMQALADYTKAEYMFGLSSGAILTLQTAIITPSIKKIALYEPPIPINGTVHSDWYQQYEAAVAKGNYGKAFITVAKATGDNSLFKLIPSFITAPVINMLIKRQEANLKDGDIALKPLIALFPYDYTIMRESQGIIDKARALKAKTLLLEGSKSQRFLKDAINRLSNGLPSSKTTVLQGLGHTAADNGGKPERVAEQLISFFA